MLVEVLLVVAGAVVLAALAARTATRARRLGRVRDEVAAALRARAEALGRLRRSVNGRRTARTTEPGGGPAR